MPHPFKRVLVMAEAQWLMLTSPRRLPIGSRMIELHTNNRHEIGYYRYLTRNSYLATVEMDLQFAKAIIRKDDRVLDVGANIGFNTLFYAEFGAGRVEAFEPTPELYNRIRVHNDAVINIRQIALSDRAGEMPLFLSKECSQGSTLDPETAQSPDVFGVRPRTVTVPIATIDDLFPEKRFDFIKLDIEGHELDCLRGAERMLAERPPKYLQTESYAAKFPELHAFLCRFFPASARLAVRRADRRLIYLDPETRDDQAPGLDVMPPTYVYAVGEDLAFWRTRASS